MVLQRIPGYCVCIFVIFLLDAVMSEIRLCSQCKSSVDPDCETNAPPPMACKESGNVLCNIIIEKDMKGNIVTFERACSTIREVSKNCMRPPDDSNLTLCVETCAGDGCNHASHITMQPLCALAISILLYIGS